MQYVLTIHAADALGKRKIQREWLERALNTPGRTVPDPVDPALEHRLAIIPEHDNRVLRVLVNTHVNPVRVVTVYFDRTVRGKL
jgi:hypothetical protein